MTDSPDTLLTQPPKQRISVLCLGSLALGILACVPGLGVFAVVFGGFGLYRVTHSNDRLMGRGFAVAGIILGLLASVGWVAVGVGARRAYADYRHDFADPAATFLRAISDGKFDEARKGLPPTLTVTDDQFRTFDAGLKSAIGGVSGPVMGVKSVMSARTLTARFIASDMQDAQYAAGPLQFDRGIGVIGIRLTPGTPSDRKFLIDKAEAIWVGLPDGRRIELVPPAKGNAP